MKTFSQFVKETVQNPNPKPPRKIAGHTFAEEQIEESKPEAPAQPERAG
jgi:hypothetical protein